MTSEDYIKIPYTPFDQSSTAFPIKYLPTSLSSQDEPPQQCYKTEKLIDQCPKCREKQKDKRLEKVNSPSKNVEKKLSQKLSEVVVSNLNNNHYCSCNLKNMSNFICPPQQEQQSCQHPLISFQKSFIPEQKPPSQHNIQTYQPLHTSPQQQTTNIQQVTNLQPPNVQIPEQEYFPQNNTSPQQLPQLTPPHTVEPLDQPIENPPVINTCLSLQQEVVNEICTRTWNYAYEMLLKQLFCDVLLISQQGTVKAHSAVLAFHSPYLRSSLENKGNQCLALNLQTVPIDTVRQLVNFLYTGELTVTKFNLVNLLNISEQYNFYSLQQVCLQFFKEVNPENVIYFLFLTNSSSLYNMKDSLLNYIILNFLDVCETPDFMFLPIEQLEYIMNSDDLNINCEMEAFKNVVRWISFKKDERLKYSSKLLNGPVRLELLSVDELTYQVEPNDWLFSCAATRYLLSEAYRKKLMMKSGMCLNEIRYRNNKI